MKEWTIMSALVGQAETRPSLLKEFRVSVVYYESSVKFHLCNERVLVGQPETRTCCPSSRLVISIITK